MSKIAIYDPYLRKFTGDMEEWWQSHGHEVKLDRYYDPKLIDWADVIWFDTTDNNLLSATNPSQAIIAEGKEVGVEWDIHNHDLTGKKVIVRPIDIEVWQGHHAYSNMWNVVTDCIFLAPHIKEMMMADSRPQESNMKLHVIPPGVSLDRWTFAERQPGKKVAIVAERWISKGVDYVIQLAMKLPDYEFHWLGKNNDYHWENEYLLDKVAKVCPNLILEEEFVPDLDVWLEDKNYLLSASHKETFGYNIAEAMAKGIKPVIHNFYGAEAIWDRWTWNSLDEAVELLTNNDYSSYEYLEYLIQKGYTLPQMMTKFDEVISG